MERDSGLHGLQSLAHGTAQAAVVKVLSTQCRINRLFQLQHAESITRQGCAPTLVETSFAVRYVSGSTRGFRAAVNEVDAAPADKLKVPESYSTGHESLASGPVSLREAVLT